MKNKIPNLKVDRMDVEAILSLKKLQLYEASGWTGPVAIPPIETLKKHYADKAFTCVNLALIEIQYESKFGS